MELVHVAVAVFSLLSLGQSAPVTDCETLTQHINIQGRDQLLGRWTHLVESTDIPGSKVLTKMFAQTSWWNITAADQINGLRTSQHVKMLGLCFSLSTNMTLENNSLVIAQPYSSVDVLLYTGCPDCLVLYSNSTIGRGSYRSLQLLSRRAKVCAAELEEFSKQLECLNLPSAVVLDSEKGFCPEPSVSSEKSFDLTDSFNNMGSDDFNLMEKLFKSDTGLKEIIDLFTAFSSSVSKDGKN
ncbi:uncharacterized protein LOC121639114 [Melanotaenia boesemani]|uniref:uncharacterized protein LOC121639114 n=1 Tax=Melanotaenia boesemani TaxID=1250792 RepID=UPI001C049736|nr:uncharacterized protein LOC121639114 [Melanotaenia boesemani]